MSMKPKNQFSYYTRIVVSLIIYFIYFYFVISNIIKADTNETRIFNGLFLILGLVAFLYEAMRITFDAATKRLIMDDNPKETLKLLDFLKKIDLFKTYETSSQMMKMLAMIDLRKFEELISFINDLEKQEITNYDVDIVSKYASMIAEGETGNKGKSNKAFKKLIELRDQTNSKGQKKKGSLFFDWIVVNGQHKNYDGDYEGAYNHLRDVNETTMNKRELVQYLLAKMIACKNTNRDYTEIKNRLLKAVTNNEEMKSYIESM